MSADKPTPEKSWLGSIRDGLDSVAEGLSVTLAQMTRRPTTVQYPDRTPVPVVDSLPERYRGFLEVDMALCTGCKACERDCPIDVIAIDLVKIGNERVMTRFDIDMGKCMYCGICVDSCPIPAQAPGDLEPTKVIRMTREFEGATSTFSHLTFRFIPPGEHAPIYKPPSKKDGPAPTPATPVRGQIARQVKLTARAHNAAAYDWSLREIERAARGEAPPPTAPTSAPQKNQPKKNEPKKNEPKKNEEEE